ncbi:MAG: sugar phosphate nucleotidyltransferase [Patescibacteria group bacterium]
MNAIILCGGLSTRLGEITKEMPKVLLEIGGKTILEWQIEKLKKINITEVVLAAGHLSEVLKRQVGDECCGVKIIYAIEEKKLGTGGAIKNALNFVKENAEASIILNGDILTTVDLQEMVNNLKNNSDGLVLGTKVIDASNYGTLDYDENYLLKSFKEKEGVKKAGFINGGIYIFNSAIKKYFPKVETFSLEYDVFPFITNLFVYESDKDWIDIGVPERLEWAKNNYQKFNE